MNSDLDYFTGKLNSLESEIISLKKIMDEINDFKKAQKNQTRSNERNTKLIINEYLENRQRENKIIQLGIEKEKNKLDELREQDRQAIDRILHEKAIGFPWLSKTIADYISLRDQQIVDYLVKKKHPAVTTAEAVRIIKEEKAEANEKYKIASYLLAYYETLFPWLIDFRGEDLDDLIRQSPIQGNKPEIKEIYFDQAKKWLTEAEYNELNDIEKYQLALDRYWLKKKSPWELGRDYERYIGYLYETKGYRVYYQGIIKGYEDYGRDLICHKSDIVEIVQCKYWAKRKTIHEKHIFQLFGTTVEYWLKNCQMYDSQVDFLHKYVRSNQIVPAFVTSTLLSDVAKKFALALNVKVIEGFPLKPYPVIKCNVSRVNEEKIYHLPFDQQYDNVIVEPERNECYVETIAEAESLGFRRAKRWLVIQD